MNNSITLRVPEDVLLRKQLNKVIVEIQKDLEYMSVSIDKFFKYEEIIRRAQGLNCRCLSQIRENEFNCFPIEIHIENPLDEQIYKSMELQNIYAEILIKRTCAKKLKQC